MSKICFNCLYWKRVNEDNINMTKTSKDKEWKSDDTIYGFCHRYPPAVFQQSLYIPDQKFPKMMSEESCGEFKINLDLFIKNEEDNNGK